MIFLTTDWEKQSRGFFNATSMKGSGMKHVARKSNTTATIANRPSCVVLRFLKLLGLKSEGQRNRPWLDISPPKSMHRNSKT